MKGRGGGLELNGRFWGEGDGGTENAATKATNDDLGLALSVSSVKISNDL